VQLRQNSSLDKPSEAVEIDLTEPVSLTFSLKYLTNFCKASGLSETVKLCLSSEVPLLVEYGLTSNSYLRFYLAPKVRQESILPLTPSNASRLGMTSERAAHMLNMSNMVRYHVAQLVAHCLRYGFRAVPARGNWRAPRPRRKRMVQAPPTLSRQLQIMQTTNSLLTLHLA